MLKRGFTLVELMVVLAIIAVVVSLTVPNMLRSKMNANQAAAEAACSNIMTETRVYEDSRGWLPTHIDELRTMIGPSYAGAIINQPEDFAPTTSAAGAFTSAVSSYRFMFLDRYQGATEDAPLVRAVMALPTRYAMSGENAFYRTTESGQTYVCFEAFPLSTTPGTPKGTPLFYSPRLTSGGNSALIDARNLSATWHAR